MVWNRLFGRRPKDAEIDDELQVHLRMAIQDRIDRGESPGQARREALRELGNPGLVKEDTRAVWTWVFVERLVQDLKYALRQMRHSPGFTAVAVLSLALGIGANAAIFSLMDRLMLRTLPVQRPEQLVEFLNQYPGDPALNVFSWRSYEYFLDNSQSFSGLTGVSSSAFQVRREGFEAKTLQGDVVAGNFFALMGVKPATGRLIDSEDDRPGSADSMVAVLSWSYWNQLDRDPDIIGRQIVVDDVPLTIIGVVPRHFTGLRAGVRTNVWLPMAAEAMIRRSASSDRGTMSLVARLRPGISIEQARTEMALLFQKTVEERVGETTNPARRSLESQLTFFVEPAGAGLSTPLRRRFSQPLLAVMAVVALLLLLTCTNLAGLLPARGAAREREMALRVSLGAGPLRIARQVLTESLLLSVAGSLIGLLFAYFWTETLVRIMASGRPLIGMPQLEIPVHLDLQVLLFAGGVALVCGLLFGLVPALRTMRTEPDSSLRTGGKAGQTRGGRWFGRGLVVAQVALSVLLLATAGLFLGHVSSLRNVGVGFERDDILLVTLDTKSGSLEPEQLSPLLRELLERLEAIPGIDSATLSGVTPLSGAGAARFVNVEGFEESPDQRRYVSLNFVAPKYFATLGTSLLVGRDFEFNDASRPQVAVVNQTTARYYFGGDSPIGEHFTLDGNNKPYEIVGVAADAKYCDLREAPPRTIYLPAFRQDRVPGRNLILRTSVEPSIVAGDVRQVVGAVMKGMPITKVTKMAEQMDASIVPERMMALLSGLFGGLGLLLAAIGLYGLLAYTVARRISEIGIRMALGATPRDATQMVLRDALGMVCAGFGIGIPMAFLGRRLARSVIEGLPADNLAPLILGSTVIIAASLLAVYLPARRAARVDPMEALRHE